MALHCRLARLVLVPFAALVACPVRGSAAPPAQAGALAAVAITEMMLTPAEGQHQWVELANQGEAPADIGGYVLRDGAGNPYRVPNALGPIPGGGIVVVTYDGAGAGADSYAFDGDGAALHTPSALSDPFDVQAGQCTLLVSETALYMPLVLGAYLPGTLPSIPLSVGRLPATVAAFVAWGSDPGGLADQAVREGAWGAGTWVPTRDAPGQTSLLAGGTIGLHPGAATTSVGGWIVYLPDEASPGAANPVPAPQPLSPPDGIVAVEDGLALAWAPSEEAPQYLVQIRREPPDAASPRIAVDVPGYVPPDAFEPGTHYWRVAAADEAGEPITAWSATWSLTVEEHGQPGPELAAGGSRVLGVTPLFQHKDTRMLCLDGDPETGPGRWDSAHETDGDWTVGNGTPVAITVHDRMYCGAASIAMIANYLGGALSQDRIAYYYFRGGPPEGDLGHGRGMWPSGDVWFLSDRTPLQWALGTSGGTISMGKPDFDLGIREWIDDGLPVLAVERAAWGTHGSVIDGYWVTPAGARLVRRIDPGTGRPNWVLWDSWTGVFECHVPPVGGVSPESDEDENANGTSDLIDDSDEDGICDFDERYRFPGLDPGNADSDGDMVRDKNDMREYLFGVTGRFAPRPPDIDRDGRRKEADPDSDRPLDSGAMDGCEDRNRNGYQDAGETSSFDPGDDRDCDKPVVTIIFPTEGYELNDGVSDCCVTMRGTILTETPITSLFAREVMWEMASVYSSTPQLEGAVPTYTFSEFMCFGTGPSSIMVRATNMTDAGIDTVNVKCTAR